MWTLIRTNAVRRHSKESYLGNHNIPQFVIQHPIIGQRIRYARFVIGYLTAQADYRFEANSVSYFAVNVDGVFTLNHFMVSRNKLTFAIYQ